MTYYYLIVIQFYNELTKNWANVIIWFKCNLQILNLCEKFQPCQVKFILKELEPDDNLKKKFTTIYPFCQSCKSKGHNWPTRGKIKVGQKG